MRQVRLIRPVPPCNIGEIAEYTDAYAAQLLLGPHPYAEAVTQANELASPSVIPVPVTQAPLLAGVTGKATTK